MLRLQFVVAVALAPFHVGNHQTVAAHPRFQRMETTTTAQAQHQHAIGADIKIFDRCFHAPRCGDGRRTHFIAFQNQAHAERAAIAAALAHQIQIARFEHAQAQGSARQQRRMQRKQRQALR
ncbi:hypothetical protein D3C71_1443820 [compost metagenome]